MWIKMFPNEELDNYKLQVELLHEKLQRSEENRQQLAQKLEQITLKRSEHDKLMHTKARQKYQQFLDEQRKRNERNKMLVQMLERIDQQTAAMSARSERLKKMKLQYEMYFAKLVQTQTMRCIQTSAAPTSIPVLLPAAAPGVIGANTAIKNNEQATATTYRNEASALVAPNTMPAAAAGAAQTFCLNPRSPCLEATGNTAPAQLPSVAMPLQGQHWTLAMATPTPAGMLLTSTTGSPSHAYDYLQYPFGYAPCMPPPVVPRAPQYFEERRDLLPSNHSSSYNDPRPTLRDFDKMTDAFSAPGKRVSTAQDFLATQYDNNEFVGATTTAVAAAKSDKCLVEPAAGEVSNEDAQQQPTLQHLLSTPSLSSSSLTFDKLPRTSMAMTGKNPTHQPYTDALAAADGNDDDDKHKDLVDARADRELHAARLAGSNNRNALSSPGGEVEKSRAVGDTSAPPARQQIDENWQAPPLVKAYDASKSLPTYDREWAAKPASEVPSSNASERFADTSRVSATQAAGNQSSTAPASSTSPTATQMSIEKIENAIYGELVNQPPEPVVRPDIRNATQELLQDLETQPQTPVVEPQLMAATPKGMEQQQVIGGATTDYANYGAYAEEATLSTSSYNQDGSDSYEPTYATIDGSTNAEVYAEPAYGEHQQPAATADYPQYAEPSGDAANAAYSNIDYANYDATQYAADAYDPNAYPGYTYDETTGQYTADDGTQQYAADANYGNQDYTQQQAYDAQLQQQPYDEALQQAANYDYANYAADNNATYGSQDIGAPLPAETASPAAAPNPAASTEADSAPIATPETKQDPSKASGKPPTSILSTPSASAAANEAQKKKKRVNFVDSSETDESSSAKPAGDKMGRVAAVGGGAAAANVSSESDFDFSSSGETFTKNKP